MNNSSSIIKLLNQFSLVQDDLGWKEDYQDDDLNWSTLCQLLGKTHAATLNTVDFDRKTHALHAYYLGNPATTLSKIRYEIDEKRNGRTFNTRISNALRDRDNVLTMFTSYHELEEGPSHEITLSDLSSPLEANIEEKIPSPTSYQAKPPIYSSSEAPSIVIKSTEILGSSKKAKIWTKWEEDLLNDSQVHQSLFSFLAGYSLFGWGLFPMSPTFLKASISIWFHQPFEVDQWLLWITDESAKNSMQRTSIYSENGRLVASLAKQLG